MLGLDMQLALAKSWNETATQWMAAWSDLAADAMSQTAKVYGLPAPARANLPTMRISDAGANGSWYRPPVANPFALPMVGFSFGAWMMPPGWMGAFQQSVQFWEQLLRATRFSFGPALAAPTYALGIMPNWMLWSQPRVWEPSRAELPALAPFPPASKAPFVSYRSDSGHAVTQVTFPNNVVAAIALPSSAATAFPSWPPLWA